MNERFWKIRFNTYEKEYIVSYKSHITILADLKVRGCNKNGLFNMWALSLTTGFTTGDKVTQAKICFLSILKHIVPYI